MLRSISMCNFVHFEDPQVLKFDEPVNFIIGGNSTGKSAIFELIRRCYSSKVSTTASSIPKEDKLAYIICNFEIPQKYLQLQVKKENPNRVVSFLFVNKKGNNSTANLQQRHWYKGVSLNYNNVNSLITYVSEYEVSFDPTKTAYRELMFEDLRVEDVAAHFSDINSLEQVVHTFFSKISNFQETDLPPRENMLTDIYEWLERGYVGVFPMRSIGPLQWTRSLKFNSPPDEMKERNYAEAGKNAEILQELLGSEKITKHLEEKYHQILVYPFTFFKQEGTIMVRNALHDSQPPWNILKTSEGILEAKQLTLILAHSEFLTITLEEPNQGMHMHMVKKIRDFILKKVIDKTVIIITHNPAFMDTWSMSRTFVCSRSLSDKTVQHNVRKFPKEYTKYRGLEEEEMKNVMFSSRILFVEGITDKIIMQAVFRSLINNGENIVKNPEENQNLQDYLLSIDIHELHSASKGNDKTKLCKKLLKEYFVLYDSDVFKDKSKNEDSTTDVNKPYRINGNEKSVKYMEAFKDKAEFLKEENYSRFASACERENIFVWKDGAIEYQIINLLDNRNTGVNYAISKISKKADEVLRYLEKKKKESKKNIKNGLKNNLQSANSDDIDIVANALKKSDEVKRLIGFFQRKMRKTQVIARKRQGTSKQQSDPVKLPKIKCETELDMSIDEQFAHSPMDDEKPSTSSDQQTGQTQDFSEMNLDVSSGNH